MIIVCPKVGLSKGARGAAAGSSGDLKERLGAPFAFAFYSGGHGRTLICKFEDKTAAPIPITRLSRVGGAEDASFPPQRSLTERAKL